MVGATEYIIILYLVNQVTTERSGAHVIIIIMLHKHLVLLRNGGFRAVTNKL